MLKVRISDTYHVDFDEVLSFVNLRVGKKEARESVRGEVKFLLGELCARILICPDLNERYLASYLVREELADYKEPRR